MALPVLLVHDGNRPYRRAVETFQPERCGTKQKLVGWYLLEVRKALDDQDIIPKQHDMCVIGRKVDRAGFHSNQVNAALHQEFSCIHGDVGKVREVVMLHPMGSPTGLKDRLSRPLQVVLPWMKILARDMGIGPFF
jgi:hypothetical protein